MDRVREFVDDHLATKRGHPLRILDVGSADVNGSYRSLFEDPQWSYVGADMVAGAGVDLVLGEPYRWRGVHRNSYDVVVSGQAFEHIEFPWATVLEVARVLKPGGLFCLVVPSGGFEHRYPVDCWRYYRDGLLALAAWADLHVLSATTYWDDETWPDGSNVWHDSVLIAERPGGLHQRVELIGEAKRRVLHAVCAFQADRRTRTLADARTA
jgi:SAM-dependent methyltransferase